MRLATRTGLASLAAALVAVLLVSGVVVFQFQRSLYLRVDDDLSARAEDAPILAAVGDRLAVSELSTTVNGARITTESTQSTLGRLPDIGLPPVADPGFRTVRIDDQDWRILTVEVSAIPTVGDQATVELIAPLGDVDRQARQLRRRALFVGLLVAIASGLLGLLLGRRATRPLAALQRDAAGIHGLPPGARKLAPSYGAPDVDDLAGAINDSLGRLDEETRRREIALGSARSFAAAASHELRTPLQGAMAQLDLALTGDLSDSSRASVASARNQLGRMGSSLGAVRALTEVDLVDASWFVDADLSDLADQAVGACSATDLEGATVSFSGDDVAVAQVWPDGAALAIENLVRNALRHGRPSSGAPTSVILTVDAASRSVAVDDNGPGIATPDRERLVRPFERGSTDAEGSGLGLAFAAKVAAVHGGALTISESSLGGTRVELSFGGSGSR